MSKYYVCQSQITDKDCLMDALLDIGVPAEAIREYNTTQAIEGHNETIHADIIISKKEIGTSHDVGLKKNEDGTYSIQVYDFDVRSQIGAKLCPTTRHGTGELLQHYTKHVILKHAKKKYGHKAKACIEKGKIKIKVSIS